MPEWHVICMSCEDVEAVLGNVMDAGVVQMPMVAYYCMPVPDAGAWQCGVMSSAAWMWFRGEVASVPTDICFGGTGTKSTARDMAARQKRTMTARADICVDAAMSGITTQTQSFALYNVSMRFKGDRGRSDMSKAEVEAFISGEDIDGQDIEFMFNTNDGTLIGRGDEVVEHDNEDEGDKKETSARYEFSVTCDVDLNRLMATVLTPYDSDGIDGLAFEGTDTEDDEYVRKLVGGDPDAWEPCTRDNVVSAWVAANADEARRVLDGKVTDASTTLSFDLSGIAFESERPDIEEAREGLSDEDIHEAAVASKEFIEGFMPSIDDGVCDAVAHELRQVRDHE